MKEEFGFSKNSTLTSEQKELVGRINKGMKDVSPEEYDKFILERKRNEKAEKFSQELSSILDEEKKYDVLELGPGTGIFTQELNKLKNIKLTSLDIRKEFVDYGIEKGRIKYDQVVIGNFEQQPFPQDSFDVLTGMAIINQRHSIEPFFAEMKRVLRDQGLVFFPWIKRKGESFENELKLLEENGFEILKTEGNYILARKGISLKK